MLAMLPAAAQAHGPVAPVATSYLARIHSVPPGLQAKIVDGYVRMWLQAPAADTVVVPDYQGAPYLRFDRSGVAVNENSTMYYLNQVPAAATPPADLSRTTPPRWVRISGGHSYEWHDGRLQALASVQIAPGVTDLGVWTVPLIVNGRATAISGELDHAGAPSIVWFWPIVVLLACVLAAWRLGRPELDARLTRAFAVVALVATALAALERGLHGRPGVSVLQLVELAVVLGFVGWAMARLRAPRPGVVVPFAIAFVALWEALNLLPALVRHYVLLALPAFPVRVTAVLCLGSGLAILLLVFRQAAGRPVRAGALAAAAVIGAAFVGGCGASRGPVSGSIPATLLAEVRPIGVGPRFQPPARGPVLGPCRRGLDVRRGVHVEVFAANRVVLIAAGIGTRPPRTRSAGRISAAHCYGELVTVDPTGIVLLAPGARLTVAALFRSWGEPLSSRRLLSFTGGRVSAYVDGRRWTGPPQAVPLHVHSEIVLEIGPHVPPHRAFAFPPET
ncbi:MAG TPA: hypothetical protein VG223_14965 [Solirubrobacteraceae bacterium]|nr:hypothetical protein [Solirubrobacteraceae bacterium]